MIDPTHGALTGLTVLEFGEFTAAPFAAKLLADYGAEVIKVERPGVGDATRHRGPFPDDHPDLERSGLFHYLNTNKLSLTLDLSRSEAAPIVEMLLSRSDILITNHSPEQLEKYGLALPRLRARHPKLITTTIRPFGWSDTGASPYGDELITAAMGGLVYSTPGMPDAPTDIDQEPPLHPGCAIAETVAGLVAAVAAMTAVFGRTLTDQGCHVDVSQQAAVAAMQQRDVAMSAYSGTPFRRWANPDVIGRMPNFYLPCKDGYVVIAAFLDHQWKKLVEAMGAPNWATSDQFRDAGARSEHWIELRLRLIEWTMRLNGAELFELGQKLELPLFPLYSIRRMVESDQVAHRRSLATLPRLPGAEMPGSPIAMRGTPWKLRSPAPTLGEHTRQILRETLNVSDSEVLRLASDGVI